MHSLDLDAIKQHCAFVFLVTKSGKIAGQLRDDIPSIDNPGKVAAFGGKIEMDEDALTAVQRELAEETSLRLKPGEVTWFMGRVDWRTRTKEWETQNFYYAYIDEADMKDMEVFEGQGWAYIDGPLDPLLIDAWRPVVQQLQLNLNAQGVGQNE